MTRANAGPYADVPAATLSRHDYSGWTGLATPCRHTNVGSPRAAVLTEIGCPAAGTFRRTKGRARECIVGEQGGRGKLVDAVVNGVVTGIWYSLPDVVASRPVRGALKVAVLIGGSLSMAHAARATQADEADTADTVDDGGSVPATEADLTAVAALMATEPVIDADALGLGGGRSARAGRIRVVGVVLAAASVVGAVVGERAIHRWGERLTTRGVRRAHTRIGLVAGLVTGVGTWALARSVPTPSESS